MGAERTMDYCDLWLPWSKGFWLGWGQHSSAQPLHGSDAFLAEPLFNPFGSSLLNFLPRNALEHSHTKRFKGNVLDNAGLPWQFSWSRKSSPENSRSIDTLFELQPSTTCQSYGTCIEAADLTTRMHWHLCERRAMEEEPGYGGEPVGQLQVLCQVLGYQVQVPGTCHSGYKYPKPSTHSL